MAWRGEIGGGGKVGKSGQKRLKAIAGMGDRNRQEIPLILHGTDYQAGAENFKIINC